MNTKRDIVRWKLGNKPSNYVPFYVQFNFTFYRTFMILNVLASWSYIYIFFCGGGGGGWGSDGQSQVWQVNRKDEISACSQQTIADIDFFPLSGDYYSRRHKSCSVIIQL